ncbi:hypothetical protein P7C71_g5449, partial [Lecanoromycetidae sp. Uapishka_2]
MRLALLIAALLDLKTAHSIAIDRSDVLVPRSSPDRIDILDTRTTLERRDPHDRGTWYLDCDKAPGACQNACFSIICLEQDTRTMYYDSGDNNAANRAASGCDTGGSICNKMPFSQKLNDAQGLTSPSCDEWPMAEVNNSRNTDPNVLRCINQPENSSGGSQLSNFIQGVGSQPGRQGSGDFVEGDYWDVQFQNARDGTGPGNSPFCNSEPGECENDAFQFYRHEQQGNVGSPYNYDSQDHYALSSPGVEADNDIVQCRVHLKRTTKEEATGRGATTIQYDATTYDYKDSQTGTGTADLPSPDDPLTVTGGTVAVKIWVGDEEVSLDDNPNYSVLDVTFKDNTDGYGGPYCTIGDVDGDSGTRDEDCYYPCFVS